MSKSTIYKNERVYRLDAEVVNTKECSEGVLSSEHHSKNTVDESLAFCILSAYRWMRRLFAAGDIPGILKCDKPEKYQNAKIDDIPSFVIDRGKYHIETESAVKAGIWTVRVTEMSVALSKNGKHGVKREITSVGFRVKKDRLFFAITVDKCWPEWYTDVHLYPSEPPQLVRLLAASKDKPFGLQAAVLLGEGCARISNRPQLKMLSSLAAAARNSMPLVVFLGSQKADFKSAVKLELSNIPTPKEFASTYTSAFLRRDITSKQEPCLALFDNLHEEISKVFRVGQTLGLMCHLAYVSPEFVRDACSRLKVKATYGDVAYISHSDTIVSSFECKSSKALIAELNPNGKMARDSVIATKDMSFAPVLMVGEIADEVFSIYQKQTNQLQERYESLKSSTQTDQQQQDETWRQKMNALQEDNDRLSAQIERSKVYQVSLEKDKAELQNALTAAREELVNKDRSDQEEIDYLRRTIARPRTHAEITNWVNNTFSNRILLHSRAIDMLSQKTAREIDFSLICDALDFLATDYWNNVFGELTDEQLLKNCSMKYKRPFEVVPITDYTIDSIPAQYKVKYSMPGDKRRKEVALKLHLRVGRDPNSLLRIYFFLDKERKLIVIGSLPHHLKTITLS